ncbi:MAG: antibiotic biosynthesis monooxygenase [Pseudomonas sp.]|nr:antibiotic biosynthesis monooxygenase [Pseudomonas sp.]
MFLNAPAPPYYAVIFTSQRTDIDDGYGQAAAHMVELASQQPGYLGIESARDAQGLGITVSYWQNEAAILAWKHHAEHAAIRDKGRARWYQACITRVAKVERAYASPCAG